MRASMVSMLVWVGCSPKDRDADTDSSDSAAPVATLQVEESGIVVCAAPSSRAAAAYDRRDADEQEITPPSAMLLGGGIAVEDYDEDGFYDLFLPSDDSVQMWFGKADAKRIVSYDDLASTALAGIDVSDGVGGVNVDHDLDGDIDILVTRWLKPMVLLRNDGDRRFTDVTASTGLDKYSARVQSASWADIDRDGDLDLFVGSYGEFTDLEVNEPTPVCDPSAGEAGHIPDPVAAQLWRNNGDGTFSDVRDLLPPEVHAGYIFMSGWFDIDEDGFPELITAHDDGLCAPSTLIDNIDGTTFVWDDMDVLTSDDLPGRGFHPGAHDMGMAVGDLTGDELPDFVLTSWKTIGLMESRSSAATRNGAYWLESDNWGLGVYTTPEVGDPEQTFGWGAEFGDLDNDMDLDMVALFGFWSQYQNGDDPFIQPDGAWFQDDHQFVDLAVDMGLADVGMGRGVVLADLNNDGWLDILKRQLDRTTPMYMSNCGSGSWLEVRLEQPGANPRGIGAKIRVTTPDGTAQVRWMTSGSTGMYSGSPLAAHFGLGDASTVDIDVVWPDGSVGRAEDVSTRQDVTLARTL